MYCPKCGIENPVDEKICISCSTPLPVVPDEPPPFAKTSALAIWSFVLAIMGLFTFLITALPAMICGIIGLVKISKSNGRLKGTGLAIAGIAIPAVGIILIPILAIMLAILMPAMGKSRQLAQRIMCSTNLSGLGKAMLVYTNDYNDTFPTAEKWCDLLIEYSDVTPQQLLCPGDVKSDVQSSYAFNVNLSGMNISDVPPDTVLIFEAPAGSNPVGGPEILNTQRHQGEGCNIIFADCHVKFVRTEDLQTLRWKPDELSE
ncbi:MAG: hypothetical protein A2Y10_11065 [Planctomycetes bacterium GWF2_41_51]|nr:MAG: hypothetical protein A2Y10_11065 [Planctomycetes bacterium GWF2_41_51]